MLSRLVAVAFLSVALSIVGCAGQRERKAHQALYAGDLERAFRLFHAMAEGGDAQAQYRMGLIYLQGQGALRDDSNAVDWLRKAAAQDVVEAQVQLGRLYLGRRGRPEQDPAAERWMSLTAEAGNADAQYKLGLLYLNGTVVPQNDEEALRWLRLSAGQSGKVGQGIDTRLYDDGLLERVASLGLAEAQFRLGRHYGRGIGLPKSQPEAVSWYLLAANQGHAEAQFYLGWMRGNGTGMTQNFSLSSRWFLKAAQQGYAEAEYQLGVNFRRGLGVAVDPVQAHMWFNLAAGHGLDKARVKRDEVRRGMTSEQVRMAEELAIQRARAEFVK